MKTETHYKELFENLRDGVATVDLDGKILSCNSAFERLTGYSAKELCKLNYRDLTPKKWHDFEDKIITEQTIKQGFSDVYEKEYRRKDGSIVPIELQTYVLRDQFGNINGIQGVIRDISERKKYEYEKEKFIEQERLARIDAEKSIQLRDEFLSIASHELKTPLTPIRMQLQFVKRFIFKQANSIPKSDIILKGLDDADKQFVRFVKLVDDLLDVSRISADRLIIERTKVNFSKLVKEASDLIKINGLTLEIEPNVMGLWDKSRIEQVVFNLLSNALKYGEGKPIEVKLTLENKIARLMVEDHGIGIEKENVSKIFGKFQRIAPFTHFGGLGLGLFISQTIIAAHGGTIHVESKLGEGSRFIVEIPTMLEDCEIIPTQLQRPENQSHV